MALVSPSAIRFFKVATSWTEIWVLDAQHLLGQVLDWDLFLERARSGNLVLPALWGLTFLGQGLSEPLPDSVLSALARLAAGRRREDWETWWQGLRARRTRLQMWKGGTVWEKLALIRWVLAGPAQDSGRPVSTGEPKSGVQGGP